MEQVDLSAANPRDSGEFHTLTHAPFSIRSISRLSSKNRVNVGLLACFGSVAYVGVLALKTAGLATQTDTKIVNH